MQRRPTVPVATQRSTEGGAAAGDAAGAAPSAWRGAEDPFAIHLLGPPVQRMSLGAGAVTRAADVPDVAARGVGGAGEHLPHRDVIQRSFGHHDVGGVVAHTGAAARDAATAIGAEAYATGNQVAFGRAPDLHTAAHEAAHVVQQRAGVHLKGGVGADGDVYEQHADAVADAVVRGQPATALLDAVPGGGGGGAAAVQRKRIIQGKDGWREAGKDDGDEVQDTQKLGGKERALLRLELQKSNPKLLEEIEQEWKDSTGEDDELDGVGELLELEGELAGLEKKSKDNLDEQDHKQVDKLSRTLLELQQVLQKQQIKKKGEGHDLRITMVSAYLQRMSALTGKPMVEQGVGGLSLQIAQEDVDAYRQDLRQAGTWAGWAEAEVLATVLGIQCDVFIKSHGAYHRVLQLNNGGNARTLSLLFLGNHYEVVGGVQDGTLVGAESSYFATVKGGDCLFESMIRIFLNGQLPGTLARMILWLRGQVADQLTDDQIEESIQGMLVLGDFGGLGSKMKGRINKKANAHKSEKFSKQVLDERIEKLKGLEGLEAYGFDKLEGEYLKLRDKDPSSKATMTALDELLGTLRVAERRLGSKVDYSSFEKNDDSYQLPLDRPDDKEEQSQVEAKARESTLKRKDIKVEKSPNCEGQYVIIHKGGEYCLDKLGQLVPRILRRNCSNENKAELLGKEHQEEDGLYPTGLSPFKIKSQVASGTGDNVIKNESSEMHHVQGHKPSPFMSATASDEDALNPKGKTFESIMTVTIDLSFISPVHITALYTTEAICYFLLDGFDGDKAEVEDLAREEQGQKQPSSKKLANKHKELSEKEWQALLDVIRTLEVLIDCMVPDKAVKKEK